jgi:hypothetical protein
MARQTEVPGLHAWALSDLASVLLLAQRTEEAKLVLDEAVQIYAEKGDVVSAERARVLRGEV